MTFEEWNEKDSDDCSRIFAEEPSELRELLIYQKNIGQIVIYGHLFNEMIIAKEKYGMEDAELWFMYCDQLGLEWRGLYYEMRLPPSWLDDLYSKNNFFFVID